MRAFKKLTTEALQKIENMESNLENIHGSVKGIRKRISVMALVPTLVIPLFIGYTLFRKSSKQSVSESTNRSSQNTLHTQPTKLKSTLINTVLSHLGLETGTAVIGSLLSSLFKKN